VPRRTPRIPRTNMPVSTRPTARAPRASKSPQKYTEIAHRSRHRAHGDGLQPMAISARSRRGPCMWRTKVPGTGTARNPKHRSRPRRRDPASTKAQEILPEAPLQAGRREPVKRNVGMHGRRNQPRGKSLATQASPEQGLRRIWERASAPGSPAGPGTACPLEGPSAIPSRPWRRHQKQRTQRPDMTSA